MTPITLRASLIQAALAAIRAQDSRLADRYHQVMRHQGYKKTVVGIVHRMLVVTDHLLGDHVRDQSCGQPGVRSMGLRSCMPSVRGS